MIWLYSALLSKRIELEEGSFLTICIDDKKTLFNMLSFCSHDFRGSESYLSFLTPASDKPESSVFIDNLFSLDPNSKKNINGLYRLLKNAYYDKLEDQIEELNKKIHEVVSYISLDFDLELIYEDSIKSEDLFKLMDLRFTEPDLELKKQLVQYISLSSELQNCRIFVTHGLHEFMDNDDFLEIHKELAYKHISIIDIEHGNDVNCFDGERIILIDNDLCDI